MAKQDESAAARVARGTLAGLVAGVAASFVMDRFQAAASALGKPSDGGAPATEQAADAVARMVAGRPVAAPDKPLAGQAVHYAFGAALGAAYGVAAEFRPAVTRGGGLPFGVAAATLFDEAAVPAVGLGAPPWRAGLGATAYGYLSHMVFGAALEGVRRGTAASLRPA